MDTIFKVKADLREAAAENIQINLKTDHFEWVCSQRNHSHSIHSKAPSPEELILSSLVASTLITLQLFINRKKWENIKISMEASMELSNTENRIHQVLLIKGSNEEAKEKLLDIAQESSIHTLLGYGLEIITSASII